MKKTKKYLVLSLAASIALSPMIVKADNGPTVPILQPINTTIDSEQPDYIKYEGKITQINQNEKSFFIEVMENEDEPYNGKIFHITEDVILLNDKTRDFINKEGLEEGMKVTGYYHKDTIMTMSAPPHLTPNIIVVNENEEPISIHVSKFNEDLISTDNKLKILSSEDTIIINEDGDKVEKEDIKNRDLIVFYTISTKSIPAQTTPEKIIVIEKKEKAFETTVFDKMVINGVETSLKNPMYKNDENVVMIPLREIGEALGYEIEWEGEAQRVSLIKGAHWIAATIGEDNYNFAKMLIKLGTAPELKDATTFVPLDFLGDVLQMNLEITEDGMITIE